MPRFPFPGLSVTRRAPALMLPVMLFAVLALSGCENSQDRAERHYKSGIRRTATARSRGSGPASTKSDDACAEVRKHRS